MLNQLDELTSELPRAKSHLAGIIGGMVAEKKVNLVEIAELLDGGQQFPLFFLILQTLHKVQGKTTLTQTFVDSKVMIIFP